MKLLFAASQLTDLRALEPVLERLVARDHQLHLAAMRADDRAGDTFAARLRAAHPETVSWGRLPAVATFLWDRPSLGIRSALAYLHAAGSPAAGGEARDLRRLPAPSAIRWAERTGFLRGGAARRAVRNALVELDEALPVARDVVEYLRGHGPDALVIVSPVSASSPIYEVLRAARSLNLPVACCARALDHLARQTLLPTPPARVLVWNEHQRAEAISNLAIPASRVAVTGAPPYDVWIPAVGTRDRREFCRMAGLPDEGPFVVYVCSILHRHAPEETELIVNWIRAIRSSDDPLLRTVNVLVRPHPVQLRKWGKVDLSSHAGVAVWPQPCLHPLEAERQGDFIDAVIHSAAVVGVNGAGYVEAGLIGRPVHAIVRPSLWKHQDGSIPPAYLPSNGHGWYRTADLPEHVSGLAASLREPAPPPFETVRGFVRVDSTPATERVVAELETISAAVSSRRKLPPIVRYPLRAALSSLALRSPKRAVGVGLERALRTPVADAFVRRHVLPKVMERGAGPEPAEVEAVRHALAGLMRTDRPIVAGPWLGEVGFELLYWIPFLAWLRAYTGMRPDRLVAVSRGGVRSWYRHVTPRYCDVLEHYGADEFRRRNEERVLDAGRKQKVGSAFETEIVEHVRRAIGVSEVEVLHPQLMYLLFREYWRKQASIRHVESFTSYRRLAVDRDPELTRHLPRRYVAVKFYANDPFPDTDRTRAFVTSVLDRLTEQIDVVVLDTGLRLDNHADFHAAPRARVHTLAGLLTPRENLAVQTAAIAGAEAFVGNYGGFAYLAPLVGVRAVSVYSLARRFHFHHLDLAQRVFTSLGTASLLAIDISQSDLLGFVSALATPFEEHAGSLAPRP